MDIRKVSPGRIAFKAQHEVVRLMGDGNYSTIYFANGSSVLMSYCLARYQTSLPGFIRTHKQHLVNPRFVQSLSTLDRNASPELSLMYGHKVPVARRRIQQVLDCLKS